MDIRYIPGAWMKKRIATIIAAITMILWAQTGFALTASEQTASNLGKTLGLAENCGISNSHRQLMWTEAYAEISKAARNDRELDRAKKQMYKQYEKSRYKKPAGGCRQFIADNPDPTITAMKGLQNLQEKFDTLNKVVVDKQMSKDGQSTQTETTESSETSEDSVPMNDDAGDSGDNSSTNQE